MADIIIPDGESPDGRPATDDEIADLITGSPTGVDVLDLFAHLEAADGTSHLDILNDTRNLD